MKYILLPLIGLDVAANVLLCVLGAIFTLDTSMVAGSWKQTLSARVGHMAAEGKPWGRFFRPIIDALFFFQPDHCYTQWMRESAAGGVWAAWAAA